MVFLPSHVEMEALKRKKKKRRLASEPGLYKELMASLSCMARPCLQKQNKTQQSKEKRERIKRMTYELAAEARSQGLCFLDQHSCLSGRAY